MLEPFTSAGKNRGQLRQVNRIDQELSLGMQLDCRTISAGTSAAGSGTVRPGAMASSVRIARPPSSSISTRIVVSDGTSQMRVTFRDYSFFLPTDSFNRTVVIRGVVTVETIDEETAKHYAEESKGEDPEAFDGPQQVVTMVADGVLVQR